MAIARLAMLVALLGGLGAGSTAESPVTFMVRSGESGAPMPCRIHVSDGSDTLFAPEGLPSFKNHFSCEGEAVLRLPSGEYTYAIERGPEFSRATGSITVEEHSGDAPVIEHQLSRVVDLAAEGWFSGDLHVHRPPEDIELLMQAEALNVAPVITWWNQTNLWKDRPLPDPVLRKFDGNRYYHLMAGEDERNGGAFMFFNMDSPIDITQARKQYPCQTYYLAEAKARGAHVDLEKPYWWDGPVGIGLGYVDSIGICNNHMWRHGMLDNEAWGRPRQHETDPPAHGNGHWVQEIYYHVLNAGLRIPPSAGSASGVIPNPVGYNRVYVHLDGGLDHDAWWEGLRAGRSFVTNGPLLRVMANGEWPGHVFNGSAGERVTIDLSGKLDSNDPVSSVQVVKDGKIALEIPAERFTDGPEPVTLSFEQSGWFLVRAIAEVDFTFRFASTAPYYVEIGDTPRTVHRESVQFFMDWIDQRNSQLELTGDELAAVLELHNRARAFWAGLLPQTD